MSPPKLPQCQKVPSSKTENGRHSPHHPHVIQISQAAPSSSLPPHSYEPGFETSTAYLNELSGLTSASSSMNQVALGRPQSLQNGNIPYSQQQQLYQMHKNAMHNWQGDDLGAASNYNYVPERPFVSYMGSGSGPDEGYPQSFHQHAAGPWMSSQLVRPSSFCPMDGREDGWLQQPRVESAASTYQNGQNPTAMQVTVSADQHNYAISGWQGCAPEATSAQNDKVPQSQVPLFDGSKEQGGYHLSYPQNVIGPNGQSMPSQHSEHSSSNSMHSSGDGGLQPPCEILFRTAQYIVVKLPIPAAAAAAEEPSSIPIHPNAMANVEVQCPLDPSTTFTSKRWTLEEVKEIEAHVRTASSCPHGPHPSLQDLVVTGLEEHERSTPLLMACLHGDLEAVKRIEGWGVNLCKSNVHPILGTLVDNVTPLFVAASKSYNNIVHYLLENGAKVSSRTCATEKKYCGLMPLHAAVLFGGDHSDMQISTIRCLLEYDADPSVLSHDGVPMWLHGDTPDGQIITLLAQWGLNLSQRAPDRGLTPLHMWASQFNPQYEDMSLDVVEMLLEKGADIQARDYYGFSVILTAAKGNDKLPNFPVLNFLLERDDIARTDKIDALELAGAVIFGNEENHDKFPLALHYWSRALALRAEGRPLYKTPIKSKNNQLSEWSTTEDLLQIEQDPTQREIQSLLVRLRILSCLSWRAVDVDYLPCFMKYLEKGVDENRTLPKMLDVSCVTMEKIVRFYPIESDLQFEASNIMEELVDIISVLPKSDPFFNSPAFETFFELFVMTDLYVTDGNKGAIVDESHVQGSCSMFNILSKQPEIITRDMKQSLKQIVRRDCRDSEGLNVLHCATSLYLADETVSTVRLLIKLGANVNAVDNTGEGALHLLADELELVEIRDATARLLLESGAHLDMVNNKRETPADVWLQTCNEEGLNVMWNDLPNWLKEDCKKLTCCCARVIRDHKVPYKGTKLPANLIPFVDMH